MADVQTLYQNLVRELRVDAATVPQKTKDDIMLAIAEALRYNRSIETWINRSRFYISLQEDQFEYPLPRDFFGIVGPVFFRPFGDVTVTSSTAQRKLRDGGQDMIEEYRYMRSDYNTAGNILSKGEVEIYAVDDTENNILFAPIPSSSDGLVHFRYLKDLGTITYKHNGTSWVFYLPNSNTTLDVTSTYTNKWFTEGFDMLRERAMYYLWSRVYGGTEESETKAQRSFLQWQDAKSKLFAEGSRKQSIRSIRPWI